MNNRTFMLEEKISEITAENTMALDEERIREDLMGLTQDIRSEIKSKDPGKVNSIYEYANLLQKEIDLYNPHTAFEVGAVLGCCDPSGSDNDPERDFMKYLLRIDYDPTALQVRRDLDAMYLELHKLLGDTGGLLDDFNEEYRQCNGIISRKIFDFFQMGYVLTHERYLYVLGAGDGVTAEGSDTQ